MPKKKNIKKLVLQSQFITEDFEDSGEKLSKYKDEFYKAFPEEYKKMKEGQMKEAEANSGNPSGEAEEESEEEHEMEHKEPKSDTMKVLYRRITKITHPDKVESEFLTSYFKKASNAYSESNVAELFTIAATLDIDVSDLDDNQIVHELEESISEKSDSIKNMKGSLAWGWAHAETEEQKELIKKQVESFMRTNYPD
jgi:hypothetical protein